MFSEIIEILKSDRGFNKKGIYLENKKNSWLSFFVKDNFFEIRFKNGGYKGVRVSNLSSDEIDELFHQWLRENRSLRIDNKIYDTYLADKEYFFSKVIDFQKEFRKNMRKFELNVENKLKSSGNIGINCDNFRIKLLPIYYFIKQFRLDFWLDNTRVVNCSDREEILLIKGNKIFFITNPLEFQMVINDEVSHKGKKELFYFYDITKEYLSNKGNIEITGVERVLNKFLRNLNEQNC